MEDTKYSITPFNLVRKISCGYSSVLKRNKTSASTYSPRKINIRTLYNKHTYSNKTDQWPPYKSINKNIEPQYNTNELYLHHQNSSIHQMVSSRKLIDWRHLAWNTASFQASSYSHIISDIKVKPIVRTSLCTVKTSITPSEKYMSKSISRSRYHFQSKSINPIQNKIREIKSIRAYHQAMDRSHSVCKSFKLLFGKGDIINTSDKAHRQLWDSKLSDLQIIDGPQQKSLMKYIGRSTPNLMTL